MGPETGAARRLAEATASVLEEIQAREFATLCLSRGHLRAIPEAPSSLMV